MAAVQLERVTKLILEEKGYNCSREVQVFEWIEGELDTLEERTKSCILCAQSKLVLQLKWDLQVVYKIIDSMRELQNGELVKEQRERIADQQRLKALTAGLNAIGRSIERVRASECICEIALAINVMNLPSMEEISSSVKNTLSERINGTLIEEMLRNHPRHSNVALLDVLNSKNLFDLKNITSSKCSVDEILQLVRCIVLYMVLENLHENQSRTDLSTEQLLDLSYRFGDNIGLNAEYRDTALAFWLIDAQIEVNQAVHLLARISLEKLFPSFNLSDFLVLSSLCSKPQIEGAALRFVRLKGTQWAPKNLDEALVVVKALLVNERWREALGLQRRFASQLPGPQNTQTALILECIFDWVTQESCKSGNTTQARFLLQYPLSLREQDCLQQYLLHLSKSDDGSAHSLATDLLFAFNLIRYRTGIAADLHKALSKELVDNDLLNASRSDKFQERQRLLQHYKQAMPFQISENDGTKLSLLGSVVSKLPRSRMIAIDLKKQRPAVPVAQQHGGSTISRVQTEKPKFDSETSNAIATSKNLVIRREDEYNSPYFAPPSKRGRVLGQASQGGWSQVK